MIYHRLMELSSLSTPASPWGNIDAKRLDLLSPRERQILEMAATGLIDKEIGASLGLSLNTLRTYWGRIRLKVGEGSRVALAAAMAGEAASAKPDQINRLLTEDWQYDPQNETILAKDSINLAFGLALGVPHPIEEYRRFYHPEDRDTTVQSWLSILQSPRDLHHLTFRRVTVDGVKLYSIFIRTVRDERGNPIWFFGNQISGNDDRPGYRSDVKVGKWQFDFSQERLTIDSKGRSILGLPDHGEIKFTEFLARAYSEFQPLAQSFLTDCIGRRARHCFGNFRIGPPGSPFCWVRVEAEIDYSGDEAKLASGAIIAFD